MIITIACCLLTVSSSQRMQKPADSPFNALVYLAGQPYHCIADIHFSNSQCAGHFARYQLGLQIVQMHILAIALQQLHKTYNPWPP